MPVPPIPADERPRVLLVDDEPAVRRGLEQAMVLAGITVKAVGSAEAALDVFEDVQPWAVVSDVKLPGMDGLELLNKLRQYDREVAMVLITGHGHVAMAVQAMREGAYDFIEKPFSSETLVGVVRRAVERRVLLEENRRLRERLPCEEGRPLIGQTPAVQRVRQLVRALAATNVDVLIAGETGAGKEVVARAIHAASGRSGPFVALNCSALPESVIESEIFGHEVGAFTGAAKRRVGRIEFANKGTLFLDEIESMPLSVQLKLLRVLQEREIERLGSNVSIPVDCRVLAAVKGDLKAMTAAGRFREDLFYRLNVVTIDVPPLRDRMLDIPLLMAHFLREFAQHHGMAQPEWSDDDLRRWKAHRWPGNIRELRNVAERLCLGLPDGLSQADPPPVSTSLTARVDETEAALIREALRQARGRVAQAAEQLHLPRKTLYDKLRRHGLVARDFLRG
ncbi:MULTISPECIES: sigma-54 dependent transcriptional regulator [unclassified Acidovorax]|uniref:sigma-54-dependent transcriptional regulator n=1 Tax=unclassified Acidovorax TaxID=2684926 RepID=UPI001C470BEE|nr:MULTISPECIES: sigma-54 dependent transcriptional regulator [unclassified Acidovorax]MBV7430775.1 sigma-54 dependent transcriptional regulator [Acidovorax sp. sif0732]MBV7451881.1 sigma-54 dependent transcriptional regulator [Acidovorax sp. sif0715]